MGQPPPRYTRYALRVLSIEYLVLPEAMNWCIPIGAYLCTCVNCNLLIMKQIYVERGMSFGEAVQKLNTDYCPGEGFYLSKRVRYPCLYMYSSTLCPRP